MHTVIHPPLSAKTGEAVKIIFTITDRNGNAVSMTGASAVYRLARRAGDIAIIEKDELGGILLSSNTAAVEFDTDDLMDEDGPLLGDFFGQLTVAKDGDTLVVAEGTITVSPTLRALPEA